MTKIKLLSALALAVFAANAATVVVSADPLLDRSTAGSIEFDNDTTTPVTPTNPQKPGTPLPIDPKDPDYPNEQITGPTGGLFLAYAPKNFSFGKHEVGAADIFSGKVLTMEQIATPWNATAYSQAIEVHDGRIDKHDWTLLAQLSAFDSGKLTGTTITIENAKTSSEFANQEPKLVQGAITTISQTSSVEFLTANPQSKGDTSAVWDNPSDVKIHVPAKEITKGTHKATVDWTLVAGAN